MQQSVIFINLRSCQTAVAFHPTKKNMISIIKQQQSQYPTFNLKGRRLHAFIGLTDKIFVRTSFASQTVERTN